MLKKNNILIISLVFLLLRYTLATMIDAGNSSDGMLFVFCVISLIFLALLWTLMIKFQKNLLIIAQYPRVRKIVLYLVGSLASVLLVIDTMERIGFITKDFDQLQNALMIVFGLLLVVNAF